MSYTAVVILAAGESLRLGAPKQLIFLKGNSLIRIICERALASEASKVIVVLGGYNKKVSKELTDLPVQTVLNNSWRSGMSSSIMEGVRAAFADNFCENIILSVVDQPYLTTSIFNQLIEKRREGHKLVASKYSSGTVGVPVLFGREYLPALLDLGGDSGAKKILKAEAPDLEWVLFPEGDFDIDTQEDLNQLQY